MCEIEGCFHGIVRNPSINIVGSESDKKTLWGLTGESQLISR